MLQIKIYNGSIDDLTKVYARSQFNIVEVNDTVKKIIVDVKTNGDKAVFKLTETFDKIIIDGSNIRVSEFEIKKAYQAVDNELLVSLRKAIKNVFDYHKKHLSQSSILEENGNKLGMMVKPLGTAGIYVPGGTANYPSSVLMTALPAKAAGVKKIIMCTPNPKSALTLVAAAECGVDEIYKVGGAQAIAAMAYGTESVPKVDIIAGPGNIYVTMAKKEVFGEVKIDMIAGPSEILIIADENANPIFVAADMLSQAEHDPLSASILVTTSPELANSVEYELIRQTEMLPRKNIIYQSLNDNGAIIITENLHTACDIANKIAPEHLEIMTDNADALALLIENAGAIFVGKHSPEPLGDYFAGPSHVLPTSGTAKHFEVLNADTFVKKISYIKYSEDNLKKSAKDIYALAMSEGLEAHANTVKVRNFDLFDKETK